MLNTAAVYSSKAVLTAANEKEQKMKTLFFALLVGLALLGSGMTRVLEAISRLATDHRVEIRAAMNSGDTRGSLSGEAAGDER